MLKKHEKRLKILSLKLAQNLSVEKTVPLKSVFDSFRYLKRLPNYKDSKFSQWLHEML